MLTEWDMILRLLLAVFLGAVVGFERERQNQPAGWRTHIILVLGSTLAMVLSINLAIEYRPAAPNGDPARLAAQVISGIGFLGAGAIFRSGLNVKGLTTAASMWTMAIVGLAVGAGMYWVAMAVTGLMLLVLELLDLAEKRLFGPDLTVTLFIQTKDRPGLLKDLHKVWKQNHLDARLISMQKNIKEKQLFLEFGFRTRKLDLYELLNTEMDKLEGVESYKIS